MSEGKAEYWQQILSFAETTTERIGKQLLKDFGQVQPTEKADGSLVTKADQWADFSIRQAIQSTFPEHNILSEESQHIYSESDWCWVIDPIDGTTNFTRGIPIWGISMGLLYRGTPVFGYVYMPNLNQAFYGYFYDPENPPNPVPPKIGAFRNHQPIHASLDDPSPSHFFCLCARSTKVLIHSFPCKIRMLGVTTYNFLMLAAGASLGGVEATPKVWDIAAVWTIVQAAGGVWVPLTGESPFPLQVGKNYVAQSFPTLVVSRPDLVDQFYPLVEAIGKR